LLVLGEENSNVSDIIAIDSCGKEKEDDFHALSSHDWPLSIHNLRPQLHYVAGHETFPGKTNRAFPSRRKATVSWNTWVPFISLATQINVTVNDSMGSLTASLVQHVSTKDITFAQTVMYLIVWKIMSC